MGNLVNAYVIYNGTDSTYVGDTAITITINCDRLRAYSPRPVYLKRIQAPGDGTVILYEPTFAPTTPELLDPNILQGYWIEVDGQDTMIDMTAGALQSACDACCGSVPVILPGLYNGVITGFIPLTTNTLCIYRFDDGSAGAHDAFAASYVGQFIGSAVMRSSFSNVSHYTITSYWSFTTFPLIGSDTIYTGACAS